MKNSILCLLLLSSLALAFSFSFGQSAEGERKILVLGVGGGGGPETDPVYIADPAFSISAGDITNLGNLSNTNSGDQTSIVGITGSLAEFNTALSGATFATGGGTATGTNTDDEPQATTSVDGIGGIATLTEVTTGSDAVLWVTSDTLEDKTYGTFSGDTISDNGTLKAGLQELETAVEAVPAADPTGSTTTVGTATSAVDTITLATDDTSYLITVYVTAEQDTNVNGAAWIKTVHITKRAGTVVIQSTASPFFNTTTGGGGALTSGSVVITVNGGDADIDVTGRSGTNLQWNSTYDIKTLSTN